MKQMLWINGENVETEKYRPLYNPFNGEKIAEVAEASNQDVARAIDAAERAASAMAGMEAHKRADILQKVADYIQEDREECARIIAEESSKPLKAARAEVDRTIMTYSFASQEARRIHGETIPLDAAPGGEGRVAYTVKEPLGVIAAITPFNFPMNLVAHKVGPALAAGNTVVLKPASQTPLSAYKIASYFHRAGLPAGALNVVTGSGKSVGDVLVSDDRVKKVTFTGSPAVGKYIRENAGLKRVTLELGSNSALIVDAGTNLKRVMPRIVSGAFSNQGQVCISIQRIYVQDTISEEFITLFIEEARNLKVGNPLDEETDIAAMISENDVTRAKSWIQTAVENGAELALGGDSEQQVLTPTVLLNAKPTDKISCEEVFAPVVHINTFSEFDEAIARVNESQFGLQAGVYTNDLQKAFKASKALHVGGVMINDIPTFRVDHMPYGGVKMSGTGREGIKYAIEEMTELKLVSFKLD
ncbi:aldehyde dehydrogenase family protein [Mesobacillus subterraneus]|jgi:acyl-CoA reductase-like NAD-dependent aldehyde dehydrogenase|uniref:aldehyde dehydrogenase family protein n=1 Tax=Mesobacillus subterraneus TaxID=285983 RepID=UPI0020413BCF|nr:aldehyde dehydrogenase family protein [Mesobacillus subterraneus]MCM3664354.1 aldehyde dehydrogenase family protein [Mesobacillus subterraneus]MCM3682381.1 aldehyde dehydrogenase family protein [Mesobacillus subterraneus]